MLAFDDGRCTVHIGHVLEELAALPADSVHCVVTSPPYLGLRDYKGLPDYVWGGDPACAHEWGDPIRTPWANSVHGPSDNVPKNTRHDGGHHKPKETGPMCATCGAWRGQLGLEPTVALYVAHLVEVFEAVRRVLRPDGTLWLNLGDSYAGSLGAQGRTGEMADRSVVSARQIDAHPKRAHQTGTIRDPGLKPKDLVGVPWMVAFALRAAGWWLRSSITWCKRAPMPESIEDRPTSATEMVFLLTKADRYFYDNHGFRESSVSDHPSGNGYSRRNARNFWLLGPEPFPGAHFAVFPSEIPRRAILLGTSERGCCQTCGAGWERQTQRQVPERGPEYYNGKHAGSAEHAAGRRILGAVAAGRAAGLPHDNPIAPSVTTGWAPSCACGTETTTPPLVLDPFLGSGTALAVAARLGRRCVGIEGNPTYLPLIEKRLRQGVLL